MITAWPLFRRGDAVLVYKLQDAARLNNRVGQLVTEYDEQSGRCGVDFGDERKRIRLRNVKPAPSERVLRLYGSTPT
eukprot:5423167-Prymnesium_polylepis.1